MECFLIIGLSTIAALIGMVIVRKNVSQKTLLACHEVGGLILSVIGTLYAIIIGMIVVSSQAKVDQASDMAVVEANMLSNIFHLANTFSEPARHDVKRTIHEYAVAAVGQDWSKVETGQEAEATTPAYRKLWKYVGTYKPENNNDTESFSLILGNLEDLSSARKFRMIGARGGLSNVLWVVLVCGGIMIIAFTYFFFLENLIAQTIMTACVAVFLSMNIYLIYICQNPYRAELGAKDAGFGYSFSPNWFNQPEQTKENKIGESAK